jgi:hypothetical protein
MMKAMSETLDLLANSEAPRVVVDVDRTVFRTDKFMDDVATVIATHWEDLQEHPKDAYVHSGDSLYGTRADSKTIFTNAVPDWYRQGDPGLQYYALSMHLKSLGIDNARLERSSFERSYRNR